MIEIDHNSSVVTVPNSGRNINVHLSDGTIVSGWCAACLPRATFYARVNVDGKNENKMIAEQDVVGWSEINEAVTAPRRAYTTPPPPSPLLLIVDGIQYTVAFIHAAALTICNISWVNRPERSGTSRWIVCGGIALLHPGEDYDAATGEKLAMKRACGDDERGRKLYSAYRKYLRDAKGPETHA